MFEHPRKYIRAIRENAKREMRASLDETDSRCESMYLYFEKHVPFDKARASAYLGFGLATIADYVSASGGARQDRADDTSDACLLRSNRRAWIPDDGLLRGW